MYAFLSHNSHMHTNEYTHECVHAQLTHPRTHNNSHAHPKLQTRRWARSVLTRPILYAAHGLHMHTTQPSSLAYNSQAQPTTLHMSTHAHNSCPLYAPSLLTAPVRTLIFLFHHAHAHTRTLINACFTYMDSSWSCLNHHF